MKSSKKENLILLYGGASPEHEISIKSSRNVAKAVDKELYNLHLIGIDKSGKWFAKTIEELNNEDIVKPNKNQLFLAPGAGKSSILKADGNVWQDVDVIFPLIHGSGGEDGSIQGLLKLMNVAFVGCDIVSSAVCMDKAVTKEILSYHNIPNTDFVILHKGFSEVNYQEIVNQLGHVVYIKPVNLGSSVGVSKASNEEEFNKALDTAFQFDQKVLIEKNIVGREIECAILGNKKNAKASMVGEVITVKDKHDFYTYEAKYIDAGGSYVQVPADLPEDWRQTIRQLALNTYQVLGCKGLARVDVFVEENGNISVNEVNTMPGFTAISMYPQMWEASGIPYTELITKLINLAKEQFEEDKILIKVR